MCVCVCVRARALKTVSRAKILHFKNTFIIIIIIINQLVSESVITGSLITCHWVSGSLINVLLGQWTSCQFVTRPVGM